MTGARAAGSVPPMARTLRLAAILLLGMAGCSRTPPAAVHGVLVSRSAGGRYPADPELLRAELDRLLDTGEPPPPVPAAALVVPHAALEFSGKTAAAAFAAVRDRKLSRIVLLAGVHGAPPPGAVVPSAHALRTPLGEVPIDVSAVALLARSPGVRIDDAPFVDEHSIDAVLPFVQRSVGAVPLVPVLVGPQTSASAQGLASALRALVDAHTLVVVSTNLTHHGPRFDNVPFADTAGAALRARIAQADTILLTPLLRPDLASLDALLRGAHAKVCGADALRVLVALLPAGAVGVVRDYDNSFSHDDSTPMDQVSYAGIVFSGSWPEVAPFPEEDRRALLGAARQALVAAATGAPAPPPPLASPRLLERHGLFLTLFAGDAVRASVGQAESDAPLGRAVLEVARAAALHPPGAPPLQPAELAGLRLELAVLGPLHPVRELSALRPDGQGLYLTTAKGSTLLLPEPASEPPLGVERVLEELARRADVPRESIAPPALRTFDAVLLSEPPSAPNAPPDAGPR